MATFTLTNNLASRDKLVSACHRLTSGAVYDDVLQQDRHGWKNAVNTHPVKNVRMFYPKKQNKMSRFVSYI